MSPLSDGPCPRIRTVGTFTFCSQYDARPKQCRDHGFEFARWCPVGIQALGIERPDAACSRSDEAFRLLFPEKWEAMFGIKRAGSY